MRKHLSLFLISSYLLSGCSSAVRSNDPAADTQVEFRVVGYATEASIPDIIPYEYLTHINYAFLLPNSDGSINKPNNLWKIEKIVDLAHEHNVQVLISVGGWGWDAQFEALAANRETRSEFIDNLLDFVAAYDLDGIDMDWEYPDPGASSEHFLALMRGLRDGLPADKLLTAAIVAYGDSIGLGIPAEVFEIMDFANLMAYDGPDHGTMDQAQTALDYWHGRGLPPGKTVLGLPFYGRPTGAPYRKIVETDPLAAQTDEFEHLGALVTYNGIPTIQAKTNLALERASGVMFWTIEHDDLQGDLSLIRAINRTIHEWETNK